MNVPGTAGGLTKLSWSNKQGVEKFVAEALISCANLNTLLQRVKSAKKAVRRTCAEMGRQNLLLVERNHIYNLTDFSAIQQSHVESVKATLAKQHATVCAGSSAATWRLGS